MSQNLPFLPMDICMCTHAHTHTQDEVYFTISTSGNDVHIVKRFQIPSRKPLGYKENHPTSNKPIWDTSPIWQSPVLLYSNKLVFGSLSQLLLLLFKMDWTLAMGEILCTAIRTPTSLGCASTVMSPGRSTEHPGYLKSWHIINTQQQHQKKKKTFRKNRIFWE